ncbi:MAG: ABC transporter substrate-binding protein/permease [Polyangiaceae bacterium]
MPSRRIEVVVFVALALASILAFTGAPARAAGAPALERVRASGVLRWGGDLQGGEPYASDDPDHPGKLVGFEVEIADLLARSLGVRAEFVQSDWSNLVPLLERGAFDVAMNGLEVTPARAARIAFTRPYFRYALRLMARTDDARVTSRPESFPGLRIGVLANSQAWDLVRASGAEAVPYEGVSEPYGDLGTRRIDAVLMDDVIADRYGVPRAGLRVVGDVADGTYAIGVRPADDDLRRALDDALDATFRSGELRAILRKWHIDGPRQDALAVPTTTVPSASTTPSVATAARTFGPNEVALFLSAAFVTLWLSVLAMALAVPLGAALAVVRVHGGKVPSAIAATYVELFRGTPVLLQLYLLYFGLADVVALGPRTAAVLGLGLNYAAYEAEVVRGGLSAVPRGQLDAAKALGMSLPMALRRVLLPQAMRFALPNVANDFVALLKDSSLVSVITVVELTKRMTITAVDTRSWLLPGLACAALYFVLGFPLTRLARRLERHPVSA